MAPTGPGLRPSEIAILQPFAREKHVPGAMPAKLLDRLVKPKAQTIG